MTTKGDPITDVGNVKTAYRLRRNREHGFIQCVKYSYRRERFVELHELVSHRHVGHPVAFQPLLSECRYGRRLVHCLIQPSAVTFQFAGQEAEEEFESRRQVYGGDGG